MHSECATGYIGGTVLQKLLEHVDRDSFKITALIRDEEKATKLKTFGVNPIIGSLDDLDKLERSSSDADVVINTAHADHLDAAKAILEGLNKRHEQTGKAPILIHTSGTGVLVNLEGDETLDPDTIYDDSNAEQIEALPPTRRHRDVDLELVAADKAGYVRTYIILPSMIYGVARGPLVDSGIQNSHSIQIPTMIRVSLFRGQGSMIGDENIVWPNVEINELADLYRIVFDAARTDANTPHGREGFYFGENGEHVQHDIYKECAKVVYDLGQAKSPEPTLLTDEERKKFVKSNIGQLNSRARGVRSRTLGWKPTKTTEDLLASIRAEAVDIVAQQEKLGK